MTPNDLKWPQTDFYSQNTKIIKGVSSPQQPIFLLELLGLIIHSKDAFFAGEYDARKHFSKFDQKIVRLTVLKFRKFEFRKSKSKWV